MYEIDKTDANIVSLLLEDGRMPASEIARRLGDVSERAVRYRIDRMIDCAIGETDVSIQIVARDAVDVYRFVTEVVSKVPGVRKTNTSIVPIVLKDVYQWRIPAELIERLQQK